MLLEDMDRCGVDLMFHTYFCDSIVEDSAVKGVIVESKSGRQ